MVGTWVLGNDLNTIYCYQDECDVDKVYVPRSREKETTFIPKSSSIPR